MKQLVKNILSAFGYQICRKDLVLIDPYIWQYIKEKDKRYVLYLRAIREAKNELHDNLPKTLRHFSLIQCVDQIIKNGVEGDFVECGVWKGHSAYIIATYINNHSRNFHIFDSFEGGLSEKSIEDKIDCQSKSTEIKESEIFKSEEIQVSKTLKEFPFIKIYKGWIPERFDEVAKNHFAFIHLDVDLYEPTLDSLRFFWDRLSVGGIIVCDDYGSSQFPGAKKAVDEFLKNKNPALFYEVPLGGCFIRK